MGRARDVDRISRPRPLRDLPGDPPPAGNQVAQAWLGLIFWFAGLEITALLQKRIGDTFSEQVWAFMHAELSRAGIAVGLVALLIVRIVEIGRTPITIGGEADLGRVLLGLGVAVWVVYHFVDREIKRRRRFQAERAKESETRDESA